MNQRQSLHKLKKGFTLVELIVVMAILAILMGIMLGVSGAIQRNAAEAKAKAEISNLMNEIEIYKSEKGSYPANWAEFGTWYTDEKYVDTAYRLTAGTPSNPIDPWGVVYQYPEAQVKEFTYLIGSKGPDGQDGGNGSTTFGEGDDITNRNSAL